MARLASSKIQESYTDALPVSRALYERARRIFPDAGTHHNRRMQRVALRANPGAWRASGLPR